MITRSTPRGLILHMNSRWRAQPGAAASPISLTTLLRTSFRLFSLTTHYLHMHSSLIRELVYIPGLLCRRAPASCYPRLIATHLDCLKQRLSTSRSPSHARRQDSTPSTPPRASRRGTTDTPANCYSDGRNSTCGTRGLRAREDGPRNDIADSRLHARSDTACLRRENIGQPCVANAQT